MPEKLSFELQREQVLANHALKAIYLHFKDCILFNWVVLFISNDLNHVDLYERICDSYKSNKVLSFFKVENNIFKSQISCWAIVSLQWETPKNVVDILYSNGLPRQSNADNDYSYIYPTGCWIGPCP